MYNKEADDEVAPVSWVYTLVAVVAIALNIGMGIYPSCMMDLLK
jgi:NADH-quinone oxidoreductase subunit N